MSVQALNNALSSVDWNKNVAHFLGDNNLTAGFVEANMRISIWSKQIEMIEKGNPALCFIREMQISSQNVTALSALCMYKSAASAMRNVLESALYYSYFRSHLVELATLIRDKKFYIQKSDIIDFHQNHTPHYGEVQKKIGLNSELNKWYGDISAVVHGQIPGAWIDHTSLSGIGPKLKISASVLEKFQNGEEIVHKFFLCTIGRDLWINVSTGAKKKLIKGISGEIKTLLELDSA